MAHDWEHSSPQLTDPHPKDRLQVYFLPQHADAVIGGVQAIQAVLDTNAEFLMDHQSMPPAYFHQLEPISEWGGPGNGCN